jgi:hypothetical protein
VSFWDVLRQRFSVTWHPRLFYLVVSDGYMVTVLRLLDRATPALLMTGLLQEASRDMEGTVQRLEKTQVRDPKPLDIVIAKVFSKTILKVASLVKIFK